MRLSCAVVAFMAIIVSSTLSALADITLTMNGWDMMPRVQISVGNYDNCGSNALVFDGAIARGYTRSFPGTGTDGVDVCFRRTLDPQDPRSPLDPTWTRCSSDGDCEIP
jgi:hypothetical protein